VYGDDVMVVVPAASFCFTVYCLICAQKVSIKCFLTFFWLMFSSAICLRFAGNSASVMIESTFEAQTFIFDLRGKETTKVS
jgi:hypothetical protein